MSVLDQPPTTSVLRVPVTRTLTPPRSAGDRLRRDAPQADRLHITERMVVAPLAGQFTPSSSCTLAIGDTVERGTLIGDIAGSNVTSPFTGRIGGQLAQLGERVRYGQPLLWLRPIT